MRREILAVALALGLTFGLTACAGGQQAKSNLDAAQAFLAQNAKQPGVMTLPSDVQYKVVTSGPADGPQPGPADEVKVNYEGKLLNGQVFDSSFARGVPADYTLGALIPAWVEAMQRMRPGDEWVLYVPPAQGYGDQGSGPIPPNSLLIFRIQLLGVLKHPAGPAMG